MSNPSIQSSVTATTTPSGSISWTGTAVSSAGDHLTIGGSTPPIPKPVSITVANANFKGLILSATPPVTTPPITGAGSAIYWPNGTWSLGELTPSSAVPPIGSSGAIASANVTIDGVQITGLTYGTTDYPALTPQPAPSGTPARASVIDAKGNIYTGNIYPGSTGPATAPAAGTCYVCLTDSNGVVWGGMATVGAPTPPNPVTGAAITVTTDTSLIYPLENVHVNCHASSFTDAQLLAASEMPGCGMFWNFGDMGSVGNQLKGWSAAHSYANAGTYTITLSIIFPNGTTSTATQNITVAADSRATVQIPNGTNPPAALASNTKYLFQCGGTWNFSNGNGITNASGTSHVLIGSYGTGAQPIIFCTNAGNAYNAIQLDPNVSSLVINGPTFDSNFKSTASNMSNYAVFTPQTTGTANIAMLNCALKNIGVGVYDQLGSTNILAQGNTASAELGQYFCYSVGTQIAIIGNTIQGSVGQALLRFVANNPTQTTDWNVSLNALTQTIDKACITAQDFKYGTIYGNTMSSNIAGSNSWKMDPYANAFGLIVDSNKTTGTSAMIAGGGSCVVVNNVDNISQQQGQALFINAAGTINTGSVYFGFNTGVSQATNASHVSIGSPAIKQCLTLNNNLLVAPNSTAWSMDAQTNDLSWCAGAANNCGSVGTGGWENLPPNGGSVPTSDFYQAVTLAGTYSTVLPNGKTAGSNLSYP